VGCHRYPLGYRLDRSARGAAVSVASGQTRRRWALVAGGVALLCVLPVVDSALPVTVPRLTVSQLRARILDSPRSYAGYVESNATFGLPALSGFGSVTSLLDGVTRMRVWQASSDRWRVDVLSDVSERDTYQTPHGLYIWDSGTELLTEVLGRYPVRLPRAADLVPPSLALRLLREAGPRARVSELPPRRVAGVAAAGLRIIPDDRASTVEHIDVWADPATGLPLQVEVFGQDDGQPALETQFLQVSSWHPAPAVLTPQRGPGTTFTQTDAADLSGALGDLGPVILPATLAGRARVATPIGFGQVGIYGRGLATFAVLQLSGSTGLRLISAARYDGGVSLKVRHGTGVVVSTRLITTVLLHPNAAAGTFVLAGFVDRQVLERAATQLAAEPW
jgi:hypothetical protein